MKVRTKFLQWLFNNTATLYLRIFKSKKPEWTYKKADLMSFPTGSLGKEIAIFLNENDIDLIPKAENHDVFHLITGYKITLEDEISMQYWLVGNRKLTPYTIGTCIIGMIVMPEYWGTYLKAFKKGLKAASIVDWDFQTLLYTNANQIKSYIHQTQPIFINQYF